MIPIIFFLFLPLHASHITNCFEFKFTNLISSYLEKMYIIFNIFINNRIIILNKWQNNKESLYFKFFL